MKKVKQPGFFDVAARTDKLTEMGPLVGLSAKINWEAFRPDLSRIHEKERKSNAGAKPIDVVLMFKVLVLQQLNNLSDDRIEYPIRDRLSFMRFLGLALEDRVPDAKTVWSFREQLNVLNLVDELFARFHEQLADHGYVARSGQRVDATFVEVSRQRNKREENALIKEGALPIEWGKDGHKLAQKDTDARWTKKNNTNFYGYKNHINADHEAKRVQSYEVTDASVHDSQVFDELLNHTQDAEGNKRAVYTDSAYRSKTTEEKFIKDGIVSQICEKGTRAAALTEEQKESNKKKSKVRVRVEHVLGAQDAMGGHFVRTIGLLRARVKIGMMNLVYNMIRLVQLLKRDVKATG